MKPDDFADRLRKAKDGFAITKTETMNDGFVSQTSRFSSADDMLAASDRQGVADFFANPPGDDFFVANTQFDSFEKWFHAAKLAAGKDRVRREMRGD